MALPTLGPPPISQGIDPYANYFYVIPQTGATSFTVDPIPDFNITVYQVGSVQFRYVGATTSMTRLPVNMTIHCYGTDGVVDHVVPFTVYGTGSPRRFPNITSAGFTAAGYGAPVNYQMTTDIPVDLNIAPFTIAVRSAHGLPAGLSIDATTGRITGTPPLANATYSILLSTGIAASHVTVYRYWMLVVGTGGGLQNLDTSNDSGTGGLDNIADTPSSRLYYDGDFTEASPVGQPIFEQPFLPVDPSSYVYRQHYWQLRSSFSEPLIGSAGPFGGFYCGLVKNSIQDQGGGIISFWREFSAVPDPRDEFESYVYGFKFWQGSSIAEVPKTILSRVHYDYFKVTTTQTGSLNGGLNIRPGDGTWGNSSATVQAIALPHAPNIIDLFGTLYAQNGYGALVAGQEYLAEDATLRLWKGNIYERKQRFITYETVGEQVLG